MKDIKTSYMKEYIVFAIVSFIFLILSFYFLFKGLKMDTSITLEYDEKINVDYNICLKENNFYEYECLNKEYLLKGTKSIATKIIDKIYINYDYDMRFNNQVSGKYRYYIKGILEANKTNQEQGIYWEQEYDLSEKNELEITNQNEYVFSINTIIDYNEYNDLLNGFKQETLLSTDGNLKVVLVVESEVNNASFEMTKELASEILLEIPLTKNSTQIKLNEQNNVKSGSIKESDLKKVKLKKKNLMFFASTISCFVACLIIIFILNQKDKKKKRQLIKINRILKTYDGIIVNVKSLPDIDKYNVIKVNNFQELIDAHSEVRFPINYYHKDTEHYFVLVNNDIAWVCHMSTKVKR